MTEQTKTRFPAPLYAAAGAGDLAYQQLRKLPAVLDELAVRVNEFSGQAGTKAARLRDQAGTADIDKIRDNAAASAIAFATTATERAVAAYTALVARGERVVGTGVIEAAELRDKAGTTDFDKLRDNAAASAIAFATTATERAVAAYTALVARGERVVGTGVIEAADVVNADIETTEEPKAVEAAAAATEPKARKRAATSDTTKASTAKRTTK